MASTLLSNRSPSVLAGAIRPKAGQIHFLGKPDRSGLSARARKGIGLMTDDRSVLFGLTVSENLRIAGGKRGTMGLFPELGSIQDRPAGLLSGGQQQMLGLAVVLSREPKLLLLDEMSPEVAAPTAATLSNRW